MGSWLFFNFFSPLNTYFIIALHTKTFFIIQYILHIMFCSRPTPHNAYILKYRPPCKTALFKELDGGADTFTFDILPLTSISCSASNIQRIRSFCIFTKFIISDLKKFSTGCFWLTIETTMCGINLESVGISNTNDLHHPTVLAITDYTIKLMRPCPRAKTSQQQHWKAIFILTVTDYVLKCP